MLMLNDSDGIEAMTFFKSDESFFPEPVEVELLCLECIKILAPLIKPKSKKV